MKKERLFHLRVLMAISAALAAVGVLGLGATILPDSDFELGPVYLFGGIALAGCAALLICAVIVLADRLRDRERRQELFDEARKLTKVFACLILCGAVGQALIVLLDWPETPNVLLGMYKGAAEVGIIGYAVCLIALAAERQMKKRKIDT